jgi:RES domain-containing protein
MIHDPVLVDRLSASPTTDFAGTVFRATGMSADPTAPSSNGGRWSTPEFSVLYTSLERDGALAEVVSYLCELTPIPRKPLRIHRIDTATKRTLRLAHGNLAELGVDMAAYGARDYRRTQEIGAVLNFLELDGLISPSARWRCENLTVFAENHSLDEHLVVRSFEDVEWFDWAKQNGFRHEGHDR